MICSWTRPAALLVVLVACLWLPTAAQAALQAQYHLDVNNSTPPTGPGEPPPNPDQTPDSSGNGNDLVSCPNCSAFPAGGRFGNYYSEANVTPMTSPPGVRSQHVTLISWVRTTGGAGHQEVISSEAEDGVACTPSYALVNQPDPSVSRMQFQIRRPGGTTVSSPTATNVADGQWHMLAGVFDGSTVRLYVDGTQVGNGTPAVTSIAYGMSERFGIDGNLGSMCSGGDFGGGIDETRVYDEDLSATEIGRLAHSTGPTPPPLVRDQPPQPPQQPQPRPQPATPVSASFTAPKEGTAGARIVLDAAPTRGATRLEWDLNGDGKPDVITPSSQHVLALTLPVGRNLTVTLTAVGPNGSRSTQTKTIQVSGPKPSTTVFKQVNPASTAATASNASYFSGAKQAGACPQTLVFGYAESIGCFDRISDPDQVPILERRLVKKHYESQTTSSTVKSICRQADAGQLPQSRCADAKKLFLGPFDVYVAHKAIKLNGVTIDPIGPASVVVYPKLERVTSQLAVVKWGPVPVFVGPVDFNLHSAHPHLLGNSKPNRVPPLPTGRATLLSFNFSQLRDVGGFKPQGQTSLGLEAVNGVRSSTGLLNLRLPSAFKVFAGKAPAVNTRLIGTNSRLPVVDHFLASVPEVQLGAVDLTDLKFQYERNGGIDGDRNPGTSCSSSEWKARANAYLFDKSPKSGNTGLKMSPPPSQNGVGFCAGSFKHVGAKLSFGGPIPRPQILPGLFLNQVNFALQLNPFLIRLGAGVSVADTATVNGTGLIAFPTPQKPYFLSPSDAGSELALLAGRRFTSTTVAVGGDVKVDIPAFGQLGLGNGVYAYSYPGYLFVGGQVRLVVPGLFVKGGFGGELDVPSRKFEFAANAEACILQAACLGGDLHLGSRGVSACLTGKVLGVTIHPGAGYRWSDHYIGIWFPDGCKPSRFWETNIHKSSVRAAAGPGGVNVTKAKGERIKQIRLTGRGGAPSVVIHGPDGRSVTVSGKKITYVNGMGGVRAEVENRTFLGLTGRAGRYTIDPLPGSAPIVGLAASRKGYDTNFKARVTGHGAVRTLVYDARRRGGGQSVTFAERGEHGQNLFRVIGTRHGGRGRIRFRPALGASGRRSIVAIASLDGTPIPTRVLTHYGAPRVPRTGRPRRVRVRRRGTRLTVRWTRARGAKRYGVVLRLSNGSTRTYKVSARRRRLRIRRVPLDNSGTVSVSARGVFGDWARPRTARFKRRRRPFTVQQTSRNNERINARRERARLRHRRHRRRHHR